MSRLGALALLVLETLALGFVFKVGEEAATLVAEDVRESRKRRQEEAERERKERERCPRCKGTGKRRA